MDEGDLKAGVPIKEEDTEEASALMESKEHGDESEADVSSKGEDPEDTKEPAGTQEDPLVIQEEDSAASEDVAGTEEESSGTEEEDSGSDDYDLSQSEAGVMFPDPVTGEPTLHVMPESRSSHRYSIHLPALTPLSRCW